MFPTKAVDVEHAPGVWVTGMISEVSPYQTEVEVQYMHENKPHARWMGILDKSLAEEGTGPLQKRVEEPTDEAGPLPFWRRSLRRMSPVDAKDRDDLWLKALVLDARSTSDDPDDDELFVSYLGMSSSNDEWVPRRSRRLAVANSRSKGRMGKNTALRLPWLPVINDEEDSAEQVVVARPEVFASPLQLRVLHAFAAAGGFQAVIARLVADPKPSLVVVCWGTAACADAK